MDSRRKLLENSMIVAAHADDELLWFTSILRDVDEAIIVFRDFWAQPQIGAQRAAAIAEHPHRNVSCLNICEAGAYGCADWAAPELTEFGIALGYEANRRAVTRLVRRSLAKTPLVDLSRIALQTVARTYEANYAEIYDALKPRLRSDMNVFTHNPWGEYGHEEHIQVFRVLDRLREEIGFRLWMSNYCTDRAMPLAMRYFAPRPGAYIRLPADKAFAEQVAAVYKKHGCWTWTDDWAWFDEECFMEAPRTDSDSQLHRHLFPLNFFTIDTARQRKWLPIALTMSAASAAIGVTLSEVI